MQKTQYVFTFDENNSNWMKSRKFNVYYLLSQQNYVNDFLRTGIYKDSKGRGYLFLNDVLDMLELPRVKNGHRLGWIYDENNYTWIDFGIHKKGINPNVKITLNVDGDIFNEVYGTDSE